MKALFVMCLSLCALAAPLSAQTNTAAPAATPAAKRAEADKPDATNQTTKATKPYPVTAIISSNTITFPILLSKKGEPLMTNAVYRRTFGRKIIFAADLSLMSFDIDKLHPSVLAQLDLDPDKAKADQATLDQQHQQMAIQNQQQSQQYLAAQAAELAKSQAAAQAAATNSNPASPPADGTKTHHRKSAPPPSN